MVEGNDSDARQSRLASVQRQVATSKEAVSDILT